MPEKRRPGTHRDYASTPSRGAPDFVKEETTPAPQEIPPRPRRPTPDEYADRIEEIEAKTNEAIRAISSVWDARHLTTKVASLETELKDNTKSTIRTEALVEGLLGPLVKEHTAKLDLCLHHIAASSHLAASVAGMVGKLDDLGKSLSGIKTEQAEAAVRFEAHDKRDAEIEKTVHSIDKRVGVLERQSAIGEATAKVQKLVANQRSWWLSAKGVSTVVAALAAAAAVVIGAIYAGGCT